MIELIHKCLTLCGVVVHRNHLTLLLSDSSRLPLVRSVLLSSPRQYYRERIQRQVLLLKALFPCGKISYKHMEKQLSLMETGKDYIEARQRYRQRDPRVVWKVTITQNLRRKKTPSITKKEMK